MVSTDLISGSDCGIFASESLYDTASVAFEHKLISESGFLLPLVHFCFSFTEVTDTDLA